MITIKPRTALIWLLSAIIFLELANGVGILSTYIFHRNSVPSLVSLDQEANLPTWYASATLFICSLLLAVIAVAKRAERDRYRWHWLFLSLFFLGLSIDETAYIHERLIDPLRRLLYAGGFFHFTWVAVGIVLVFIMAALYWKFIFSLTKKMRMLFIVSGGVYVSGALVMEMIAGFYHSYVSDSNLAYTLITTWEETLEMTGIVLFIFSLLTYISSTLRAIRIDVSEKN